MNLKQRLWTAARIVLISVLVLVAFGSWQADYYQNRIGEPLRHELAFGDGSPYVVAGNSSREVLTLHPHVGGSMERAGVRNGDIVFSLGRNGFYRSIQNNRGAKFPSRSWTGATVHRSSNAQSVRLPSKCLNSAQRDDD